MKYLYKGKVYNSPNKDEILRKHGIIPHTRTRKAVVKITGKSR